MGINLQGNVLYIKRSSGLVPTYSFTSGLNPTGHINSNLGIIASGQNQITSHDEYNRTRENTISKVICIKNMIVMKEVIIVIVIVIIVGRG